MSPEDLVALSAEVEEPDTTILLHASHYLGLGTRDGLETAHNLVCDVISNYGVQGLRAPESVTGAERELRAQRIARYGSVGRPVGQSAPSLTGGW